MQRMQWYLGSLLMGATLLLPVGLRAATNLQQGDRQEAQKRYYDRNHKDYHSWDDREDGSFRRWMTKEKHKVYRPFTKLKRREQSEYWEWRHAHPDDADRDRR